jgi:hypothetical protein
MKETPLTAAEILNYYIAIGELGYFNSAWRYTNRPDMKLGQVLRAPKYETSEQLQKEIDEHHSLTSIIEV